jgi:AcrR family transcriptional regulator
MNKRAQQKVKTHDKILSITKKIYLDQGYDKTSTKKISKQARVSQGTIFLHFDTKEKLLKQIIVVQLDELFERLRESKYTIPSLFQTFVEEEALLSRVIKDYHVLPSMFQESFNRVKMIYKDILFDLVKPHSELSILDLFSLIEMILALIYEDLFYSETSVMKIKVKKYVKLLEKYS